MHLMDSTLSFRDTLLLCLEAALATTPLTYEKNEFENFDLYNLDNWLN